MRTEIEYLLDPFELGVRGGRLTFPNVYEPQVWEGRPKYGALFEPTDPGMPGLASSGVRARSYDHGALEGLTLFQARSSFRPEVTSARIDEVVAELARLEARNLPGDALFRTARVRALTVHPYRWTLYNHAGNVERQGVSLGRKAVHLA